MLTIGLAYILAATAASALFVLAAWGTQRARPNARPRQPHPVTEDAGQPHADVAIAVATALRRLEPLIERHAIRIQTAIPPDLRVRLSPERVAALIEDLLATVINAEPWAHLLLSAERHGLRVDILLSDDCAIADAALWRSLCRDLTERVALLGGSLDIMAGAPHGTTMVGAPHGTTMAGVPHGTTMAGVPHGTTMALRLAAPATAFRDPVPTLDAEPVPAARAAVEPQLL